MYRGIIVCRRCLFRAATASQSIVDFQVTIQSIQPQKCFVAMVAYIRTNPTVNTLVAIVVNINYQNMYRFKSWLRLNLIVQEPHE